jgi:mitofusin
MRTRSSHAENAAAIEDLVRVKPVLERMKASQEFVKDGIEAIEDIGAKEAGARTWRVIEAALARVGAGELAALAPFPAYRGLLGVRGYARDVRRALLESVDGVVRFAEDEALRTTRAGIDGVAKLGEQHLPTITERSSRVFMLEAMFRPVAGRGMHRASSLQLSAPGAGLGLALAQRTDLLEPTFFNIVDTQHVL